VLLTRRELVGGAAASALAATGIYELVDLLVRAPARASAAVPFAHTHEQHILQNLRIVSSDGVDIFVPPLHHQVVTATLRVDETRAALAEARAELEHALRLLDDRFAQTPAGLGVTVAWGLPYFVRYVPGQARRHLPVDRRATAARGRQVRVLEDAKRFPSDPRDTILEANDVAFLFRSDSREHIAEAAHELFAGQGGAFRVTSIRAGFVGGGFEGGRSLPKQMAIAAGVPGAEFVPDNAELFLGFTSTQRQAGGRERIANLETLGYADLGPAGYFRHGTHMHLSHLFEDLEAWYRNFSFQQRAETTFHPGLRLRPGTETVRQGPKDAQNADAVVRDYERYRRIGHSGSIQAASRLERDVVGPDGVHYRKGTAIPRRLQHPGQPLLLERPPGSRPFPPSLQGRAPFRRLQPDERRLPPQPPRNGRRATGWPNSSLPPRLTRPGLQRRAYHDASPELSRPAEKAPLVPAHRTHPLTATYKGRPAPGSTRVAFPAKCDSRDQRTHSARLGCAWRPCSSSSTIAQVRLRPHS
jgi:hypothetical protein